jgi:CRP-like cAMP-binding protein
MPQSSIERSLRETKFFSDLDGDDLAFLAAKACTRHIEAGQVLFHYGERARHFYLVTSGHISLEVAAIEGPALELQDLGPGEIAGWSWLISPHKWSFQARTKTTADVIEFDGDAILARCEADPAFGYGLLKRFSVLMSERLQFARQRMMQEWKPAGFA